MALALLSLTQRSAAQDNLVTNGGFDASTDLVHADGWTQSAGTYFNSKNGNPAPDLVLEPTSPTASATASQGINGLTPGFFYIVSGDYYRIDSGTTPPTGNNFGVSLDSAVLFQAAAPLDFQWHSFTSFYTAESSSAVLTLTAGLNGTGVPYMIDNISIESVSEPATGMLLWASALGCLCYARRLRQVKL